MLEVECLYNQHAFRKSPTITSMTDKKNETGVSNSKRLQTASMQDPAPNPFLSRVAASASGLARDALRPSRSHELFGTQTAASSSSSAKMQSFPSLGGAASRVEVQRVSYPNEAPGGYQAFRDIPAGTTNNCPDQNGEGHFQIPNQEESLSDLCGPDVAAFIERFLADCSPISESGPAGPPWGSASAVRLGEAWTRSIPVRGPHKTVGGATTVEKQIQRDGSEVVNLLTQPGGAQDFEPPGHEEEHFDWGLSTEQLIKIRDLTKDLLPPPEPHTGMSVDHPLNLIPNFEFQAANEEQCLAVEARQSQWESVLHRYADEVWGGLLPLVKEARVELSDAKKQEPDLGHMTALRRLKAVLLQLQG